MQNYMSRLTSRFGRLFFIFFFFFFFLFSFFMKLVNISQDLCNQQKLRSACSSSPSMARVLFYNSLDSPEAVITHAISEDSDQTVRKRRLI